MMRVLLALAAAAAMTVGYAKDDKLTAQQERMKDCNAQANKKHMRGDERQDFMSSCLRADGERPRQLSAQQEKMRTCNRTASERELKGDERREFMSDCLKGQSAAAAGGRR